MQPNNVLKLYSVSEDTTLHMNISQVVWSRKFDHFWDPFSSGVDFGILLVFYHTYALLKNSF